jgi:adenylate kinase
MHQVLSVMLVLLCWVSSSLIFGSDETQGQRPYVVILYGAPGSGRASMAVRLRHDFAFPTISLTTLLANHVLEGTSLGSKGRDYVINGGELPQELLPAILSDRLLQPDCSRGAFLEDMSLTIPQVLDIENQVSSHFQFLVLNIDASDDWLVQRVERRLVCYSCGYVYDDYEMSKKQKEYCDICSSPLQRRQGDAPEVIKARLDTYRTQVSPLLSLYKNQEILVQIAGNRKFDDTYKEILHTIEARTGLVASKNRFDTSLLDQE